MIRLSSEIGSARSRPTASRSKRALLWLLLGVSPPLMILVAAAMYEGIFWLMAALMVLIPCWLTIKWYRAAREGRHLRSQLRTLDAELAAALERSPDDDTGPAAALESDPVDDTKPTDEG